MISRWVCLLVAPVLAAAATCVPDSVFVVGRVTHVRGAAAEAATVRHAGSVFSREALRLDCLAGRAESLATEDRAVFAEGELRQHRDQLINRLQLLYDRVAKKPRTAAECVEVVEMQRAVALLDFIESELRRIETARKAQMDTVARLHGVSALARTERERARRQAARFLWAAAVYDYSLRHPYQPQPSRWKAAALEVLLESLPQVRINNPMKQVMPALQPVQENR